jgi:hypothetical protein
MDVIFRSPPEVWMVSSSNFVFFTTGSACLLSLSAPI